tara:strand:+ start:453 stop:689 length:237 start_codon:yes stop_codon:yes gene_type:complete
MSKKLESFESFQDLYSSEFIDVYAQIKEKLDRHALDLLNQESKSSLADFIKLIFDNVNFETLEPYEEDDEIIDLQNYN